MIHLSRIPAVLLIGFAVASSSIGGTAAGAEGERFTATVAFQQGAGGYDEGSDDTLRPGNLKLVDDVKRSIDGWTENQITQGKLKREEVLEGLSNYRHVVRWGGVEKRIRGEGVKVVSAKVELYYSDEFWSYYKYSLALHRSLDGTKDGVAAEPAGTAVVCGDRCEPNVKTKINSWVTFELAPAEVQKWIDDPASNKGLVLLQTKKEDPPDKKSTGSGLHFRAASFGDEGLRPKLSITYEFTGNVAPLRPTLLTGADGQVVGDSLPVRWTEAEPKPDLNSDKVSYEVELGRGEPGAVKWGPLAKGIASPATEYAWDTRTTATGAGYRLRLRAVDPAGAASNWCESPGAFEVVRGKVSFNVGVATPVERIGRLGPPGKRPAGAAAVSLARGESEGLQLVVMNVTAPCAGVKVTAGELSGPGGKKLPADAVAWNPVGYVRTTVPKYSVPRTGLWADPLLPAKPFDLEPGKTQPVWVTVKCPRDAAAGLYRGRIAVETADGESRAVELSVAVRDFELPVTGHLKTMVLDSADNVPKFYGHQAGTPEFEKTKKAVYEKLLESRIGPGGSAMCGFGWAKPGYPVKFEDGKYDFSEADRWGEWLTQRGMSAFIIAKFPKLGKYGFPNEYSEQWKKDWSDTVKAYADHLREKGWLERAYAYNIDEAPKDMWETCKQNHALSKSAAKDLRVFQCLNDPPGVAALAGFADTWDVNVAQYHQSEVAKRQAAGDEVWWCICCWPSSHPNLFLDYPAMDARIVGWLSWKLGVSGFEYWAAASWGKNKVVDKIESDWIAKVFGEYNGDGYLLYPGPDGEILSSIRLEALRDGFEDYEYLAILKDLVAKAKAAGKGGEELARAEALLEVPDEVCRKDLSFTGDPAVVLGQREKLALAIEALGRKLK